MLVNGSRATTQQGGRLAVANPLYESFCESGYAAVLSKQFALPPIDAGRFLGMAKDRTFFNAVESHWGDLKPLVCDVLEDQQVKDCLLRYFDGCPWLWNVALNYSEPNEAPQDSQLWHFDYGDTKQLHIMIYFSDVDLDSGPFTFFPADLSRRIPRSKFVIERLTDTELEANGIKVAESVRLTGKRGDVFIADPGRVLHQGARCKKPRLVLFLTFTSTTPMSDGGSKTLGLDMRRDLYKFFSQRVPGSQAYNANFFV